MCQQPGGPGVETDAQKRAREQKERDDRELEEARAKIAEQEAEEKKWRDKLSLVTSNTSTDAFNLQPMEWFIEDNGAQALAEAFKTNTAIQTLNLAVNGIGPVGTKAIADMLKVNSTLTSLNMRNNNIKCEGLISIADAMMENKTLQELDLRRSWAEENGALRFGQSILGHPSLKYVTINVFRFNLPEVFDSKLLRLDVSDSKLEEGDVILVAALAKRCPELISVSLANNEAKGGGVAALCAYLKSAHNVTDVNLSSCDIDIRGAREIASLIDTSSSLRRLNISNNPLTDDGVMAILHPLSSNPGVIEYFNMTRVKVRHGTESALRLTQMKEAKNNFEFLADPPALTEFQREMLESERLRRAHEAEVERLHQQKMDENA